MAPSSAGAGGLHAQLVALGAAWLRRQGFPVVWTELSALRSRERPDVVGFRETCSAIIEVKASRADFLADARKPHRGMPSAGVGTYRFYLCPPEVAGQQDLPARWGLLHVVGGRKLVEVVRPPGNLWPGWSEGQEPWRAGWIAMQHQVNAQAERALLFSIARRLAGRTAPNAS